MQEAMQMKFMYNGVELPAPEGATPAQVKDDLAAAFYPELNTAEIRGPRIEGNTMVYEFVRAAGTKGKGGH
ncbi:hypothetical protein B1757_13475 [Acidithiobacillus marinus]|uniref:PRTRC system protein C n=1 Tax=Acidithiobacillus marinus TaxID=187490 RepID=A0A2I1DIN3_9PROT|nr:PRTRC system protein C [Acidithiobacillus marinus]PKY09733.1 hypothetical protein B1757_13475 [Acidithiobacillus marinus]